MSGGRILVAGLIAGLVLLAVCHFLLAMIATTTVRLSPHTVFWSPVLLGAFGLVAGMGLEAVRQLGEANPDPDYHRRRRRHGPKGR
jgi:hypothetical protein